MADTETKLVETLVTANRMLANENIIDVFGHISVRSDRNPQEFLLSCSRSPQAVTASDIMRYKLDGTPITETKERHYAERVIHAAILAARPEINSVCHTHSDAVLPFAVTGEPIRPVIHAGTLFWEGVGWYEKYDAQGNLLVASATEGKELAASLGPRRAAVLKNHGAVVVGKSIAAAVLAAIHLEKNARTQLEAMRLGKPMFIEAEEGRRGAAVFDSPLSLERAWGYWLARLPEGWRHEAGLSN